MVSLSDLSDEVLTLILSFCNVEDLLTRLQLVNRRFSLLVQTAPSVLKTLTFMPSDEQPPMPMADLRSKDLFASEKLMTFRNDYEKVCLSRLNRLIHRLDLFQLVTAYIDDHDEALASDQPLTYWERAWSRHLVTKTPWLADPSRRRKWLREDASWRKFLLCSTPNTVIRRLDVCSEAFNLLDSDADNWQRIGHIEFGNQSGLSTTGMTIGDLYDLLTVPELGLFKKGLRHNLGWRLKIGSTWKPGESEGYEEIQGRACLYIYHLSEEGRKESEAKYETPQDHGNLLDEKAISHENGTARNDATRETTHQDHVMPRVEDYAVENNEDVVHSGRLAVTWEDEYMVSSLRDPDRHSILCEVPCAFGPTRLSPFVMKLSPNARKEHSIGKELNVEALKTMRENNLQYLQEMSSSSS